MDTKSTFGVRVFTHKSDFKQINPYDFFETINDSLFDAALYEAPNKATILVGVLPRWNARRARKVAPIVK